MKYSDHLTAFAPPQELKRDNGKKALEQHNVARVKSYLERNLGCMQVEVARELNLDRQTVAKAIKIIRGRM